MSITITSTTSSQEQLDHAASENWREPFVPKPAESEEVPKNPEESEQLPKNPKEESEETPETPEPPKPQPKGHKGAGAQKRIDKLTARVDYLERRNAELEASTKPAEPKAPEGPKEPKFADFNGDVDKFVAARDAWKDAEELRVAHAERQQALDEEYGKKIIEAKAKYDDWDEVVAGSKLVIPQVTVEAIKELDNSADVAYYLATHQDEAKKLMEMSATSAVREVGRISDKLTASTAPAAPKPKVKPPDPVAPVGTSATRGNIPLDQLPVRDYIKIRNRQERENRGR